MLVYIFFYLFTSRVNPQLEQARGHQSSVLVRCRRLHTCWANQQTSEGGLVDDLGYRKRCEQQRDNQCTSKVQASEELILRSC